MASDLAELLERVKAATAADRELDLAIRRWERGFEPGTATFTDLGGSIPPVTASLDAALALVERVLPGGWIDLNGPRKYLHIPTPVPNYWRAECGDAIGWGSTSALALLAALLSALAAQDSVGSALLSGDTK